MENSLLPFGPGAIAFIAIYLLSLIGIGWVGHRARREDSLQDFYLAGRGIGLVVLTLTLYATQYSGNTLFGFSGKTYRIGFSWVMSVHFMTAIIVVYVFFAPRLYRQATAHQFITPSDFLAHRYGSSALNLVASVLMIVAIANFLLAQMMAMGRCLEGLTTVDPRVAYSAGILGLAVIIVVYETLGGFRAVAWTDVVQGVVLLVGFIILIVLVFWKYGSLSKASERLLEMAPEKVLPPGPRQIREWFSYIAMVGLGGALYPQAIQRIYASTSEIALRRSLAIMAFLPLTTTVVVLFVGIMGAAYIPGLITAEADNADTVLTVMCREIQTDSAFGYGLVVVLMAGVLAALMSTADSVLLSISSMLSKDIYGVFLRPAATQSEMTRFGKAASWFVTAVAAVMAIALRDHATLVQLLDRKFDLLVQLAPAFLIGIYWERLRGGPVLIGLLAGTTLSIVLAAIGLTKPLGVHAGLYGLALNTLIAVLGSRWAPGQTPNSMVQHPAN